MDVANYYSGDVNPFGLFNRYGVPRKTYYAMDAFRRLLTTPRRVHASGWQAGRTAVCAGIDSEQTPGRGADQQSTGRGFVVSTGDRTPALGRSDGLDGLRSRCRAEPGINRIGRP